AVQVPAVQVKRGQVAGGVGLEVVFEFRDQRQGVGKIAFEQGAGVRGGGDGVEVRVAAAVRVQGHEQGDGEGALVVGQGDAHVATARPDVQRVGLDPEATVGRRRDFQFLVAVFQPLGALAQV